MRPVRRSPSSTMIPRLSPTWRTARSTFGSSRTTTGNTTSSSRLRLSLAKPTTDVSGVRSSCDTLARKRLLASFASSAAARASWASVIAASRSAVRSATRASRARFWASSSARSRADSRPPASSEPTVYSSGPSSGSSGRPSRASVTSSTPTTRPWVTSGVPDEPGRAQGRGEAGVGLVARRPPRPGTGAGRRRGRAARGRRSRRRAARRGRPRARPGPAAPRPRTSSRYGPPPGPRDR